jgi:leader peptidase (prepilin peptidase)/N-methyltransferase
MLTITEAIATLPPGIYLYLTALVFWFGACLGSFLNVCIYRIPREESVISPGSHCPHCNKAIHWYDNIPLVSFCVLQAKCRNCKGSISPRYVIVETLIAILFVLVWLKVSPAPVLGMTPINTFAIVPIFWLAVFGLALGTFVDLEHMIIPDRVSLGGIVMGLALSALIPNLQGQPDLYGGLIASLLGASIGVGILWAIAILGKLAFKKDAMGMGDVKLMGAIGAFLGWPAVIFTLMLSSFLGAIFGVSMIVTGKKEMQSRIPFGPYIAVAALIWILWGPTLFQAYLNLLMPPIP